MTTITLGRIPQGIAGITLPAAASLRVLAVALTLLAIPALAAVLRLVGLGDESLWGDEIHTIVTAHRPWMDIVTRPIPGAPPLSFLLVKAWTLLLGESEFTI